MLVVRRNSLRSPHSAERQAHSVKYRKRLMVNGEQLQDHALIRLPFTLYCLPKRYAPCSMRYAIMDH